jgi:hypothetical protein
MSFAFYADDVTGILKRFSGGIPEKSGEIRGINREGREGTKSSPSGLRNSAREMVGF